MRSSSRSRNGAFKNGAQIKETEDGLHISGAALHGAEVDSHNDHRMAMALAVAAMGAKGTTTVHRMECTSKTYPTFIKDFQSVGVDICEHHS